MWIFNLILDATVALSHAKSTLYVCMFYAFFNHFYSSIFEIALWITALSSPYIAQERTAQSAILSVRSERFALCLKERHRSQNQGSLKSERAISKSDVPSSDSAVPVYVTLPTNTVPIPMKRVQLNVWYQPTQCCGSEIIYRIRIRDYNLGSGSDKLRSSVTEIAGNLLSMVGTQWFL